MHNHQPPPSRRLLLKTLATLPLSVLLQPSFSKAAPIRSGEVQSELSNLASKIPGAGMPDVYYPDFFLGDWVVTRELYSVETPDLPSDVGGTTKPDWLRGHTTLSARAMQVLNDDIGRRQTFHVRFYKHRGKIVEDRRFNVREEVMAVARGSGPAGAALMIRPADGQKVDVTWDADDPNVTTIAWDALGLPTGVPGVGKHVVREAKVTKRSFVDAPQGYGTFISSEYSRMVDFEGEGALLGFGRPPSIYGKRCIKRYKVSSVNREFQPDGIDRLVVEYIYPPSPPNAKPSVLMKYRDFLNRVSRVTELVGG